MRKEANMQQKQSTSRFSRSEALFREIVVPYIANGNSVPVVVPSNKTAEAVSFAKRWDIVKLGNNEHGDDHKRRVARMSTGVLGELAVEILLGREFIDWSLGHSKKFRIPDLKSIGYRCGVKSVEEGKFPLIMMNPYCPEIICVVQGRMQDKEIREGDQVVYVCGVAPTWALKDNKCRDFELVLAEALRDNKKKTGFSGFSSLIPFYNHDMFKELYPLVTRSYPPRDFDETLKRIKEEHMD